jgi:hypothetical protein
VLLFKTNDKHFKSQMSIQQQPEFYVESQLALVVLDVYSPAASPVRSILSHKADISAPDAAYEGALELFENTCLGGDVIWISAEGLSLEELVKLEAEWMTQVGKVIMLMGANQASVMNRSLQSLMTARRNNPSFQAVVVSAQDNSITETTFRFIAQQSGGWMRHHTADANATAQNLQAILGRLSLSLDGAASRVAAQEKIVEQAHSEAAAQASALAQTLPEPAAAEPSAQIIELASVRSRAPPVTDDSQSKSTSTTDTPPDLNPASKGNSPMASLQDSMNACLQIEGAFAAALVDTGSGMALAKIGTGINLDVAAAGNTEVVKAKMKTMAALGVKGSIEDILITLDTQFHLIRIVPHKQGLFIYLAMDKARGNLAMARFKLMEIEKNLTV